MEIKILEEEKSKLIIEIEGEDDTFCNTIKDELHKDKDVKIASYKIPHPLKKKVTMQVEGKDPKKSLVEAAKRVKKNADDFGKAFAKK